MAHAQSHLYRLPTTMLRFFTVYGPWGRTLLPMQAGNVPRTHASDELLEAPTSYRPNAAVADGVKAFVAWYREHRGG